MPNRKVYCEIIQGITYEDRCLFQLCQVIEDNKTCEDCILREAEKLKSAEVEERALEKKKKAKSGSKRKVRSDKESIDA